MTPTPEREEALRRVRKALPPDHRRDGDCPDRAGVCWCEGDAAHSALDRLAADLEAAERKVEAERKARKAVEAVNADEVLQKRTNLEAMIESERVRAETAERERDNFKKVWNEDLQRAISAERDLATAMEALERIATMDEKADDDSLHGSLVARLALRSLGEKA